MDFKLALGFLGLLSVPIIILIYILKSKYVSKPVSSTFIWKRSLKYVKNRLPINFVFSLLLVLQILAATLASFALARPTIVPLSAKDTVIILDASASMMTKNSDGKTRFELAVQEIEQQAAFAGDNHKFTIISADSNPRVLVRSSEKVKIVSALSEAQCGLGTADIDAALTLANDIQAQNPDAKLVFYTDKTYFDASGVEIKDFSDDDDFNAAITNLTDSYMGGKYSFNATVNLYGPAPEDPTAVIQKNVQLVFYLDGQEAYRKDVTLNLGKNQVTFTHKESLVAPGDIYYQISSLTEYTSVKVEIAKLTEVDNTEAVIEDGLLEDNSRYVFAKEGEKVKILVVSTYVTMTGDEEGKQPEASTTKTTYLITLLRNIGYTLSNKTDIKKEISQVNNGGAIEGYNLYIFDGVMPEVLPTDGAVWFLNPPSNPVGTDLEIDAKPSTPKDYGETTFYMLPSPNEGGKTSAGIEAFKTITRNIAKRRNIAIGKFRPIFFTNSDDYYEMFSCNNSSIVVAGREANVRIVCMSFDIHDTNLHMLVDFPLLINNMLTYSLPSVVPNRSFDVGETIKFNAPVGATELEFQYRHENGDIDVKDSFSAEDASFTLELLGNYAIVVKYENGYEKTIMLPTHIPEDESDITLMGESIESKEIIPGNEIKPDPMEIWPYIVMALLAILIIEWGVYYRDEF